MVATAQADGFPGDDATDRVAVIEALVLDIAREGPFSHPSNPPFPDCQVDPPAPPASTAS